MIDKDTKSSGKLIICYNILCAQKKDPSPPSGGVDHDFTDWETFKLWDEKQEFSHDIGVDKCISQDG